MHDCNISHNSKQSIGESRNLVQAINAYIYWWTHFICRFVTSSAAGNKAHILLNPAVDLPSRCVCVRKVGHHWIVYGGDKTSTMDVVAISVIKLKMCSEDYPVPSLTASGRLRTIPWPIAHSWHGLLIEFASCCFGHWGSISSRPLSRRRPVNPVSSPNGISKRKQIGVILVMLVRVEFSYFYCIEYRS